MVDRIDFSEWSEDLIRRVCFGRAGRSFHFNIGRIIGIGLVGFWMGHMDESCSRLLVQMMMVVMKMEILIVMGSLFYTGD